MKQICTAILLVYVAAAAAQTPVVSQPLTAIERSDITFLIWEEKFARDVYTYASEQYGDNVFTHKINAEQHHLDLLTGLLPDLPDIPKGYGEFPDPFWMKQFTHFRLTAGRSLSEALKTGALIEEQDIADLEKRKANATSGEVIAVYDALISASEQHLRSFLNRLEGAGITYTPQVLTNERVTTIRSGTGCCSGTPEKCQGDPKCKGGAGKGGC